MNASPAEIAMMAAGAAIGGFGVWLLLFNRPKPRKDGYTSVPPLTEPTRLTFAMVCIVAGYHLILWALPPGVAAVQFPRSKWYVWILVGIGILVGSLALDRRDRNRASDSSPDDPDRPSGSR